MSDAQHDSDPISAHFPRSKEVPPIQAAKGFDTKSEALSMTDNANLITRLMANIASVDAQIRQNLRLLVAEPSLEPSIRHLQDTIHTLFKIQSAHERAKYLQLEYVKATDDVEYAFKIALDSSLTTEGHLRE